MDVDAARKQAGLKPLPNSQQAEPVKERGHARGRQQGVETEDATIGNEELLRGIPAVGQVAGTIKGTRPGDSAAELERAGRDIVRANLNRNRKRFTPNT
jgi:hypothetical protein